MWLTALFARLHAGWRYTGAFDAAYYLRANPDVAAAGVDPWIHFINDGILEGRRPGPLPLSPEDKALIVKSGLFDAAYYLRKNADVAAAGLDPLTHFLERGAVEGRDPGPGFRTRWYRNIYIRDENTNALLHYLRLGKAHGQLPCLPPEALSATRELIADLNGIDPAFDSDPVLRDPEMLPYICNEPSGPVWEAFRELFNTLRAAPDHILCAPWMSRGGSDKIVALIARMAVEHGLGGHFLMLLTETTEESTRAWLPPEIEVVSFASRWPALALGQRAEFIDHVVRHFRPKKVLNVNSASCWEAYRQYGPRMAANADLYAYIFCQDFDNDGYPMAFIDTHIREALPILRRLYSDNHTAIDYVCRVYGVPASLCDKFGVALTPAMASVAVQHSSTKPADVSLRVFWTGRFARQKNLPLLAAILKNCPASMRFDIWGEGPLRAFVETFAVSDSRVRLRGPYGDLGELPLSEYDAFLFTSLHEGRPNVLIEQATNGFPIVASNVGGVNEILDNRAWLIDSTDDPAPYVAALNEIAANLEHARAQALALAATIVERDTPAVFYNAISGPGDFLGGEDAT